MELKKQIGKRIQNIRKSQGITQEGLAEMIGIEVPSLSNIETGKYSPSIETIQKLATALNVKVWEFYYVEEISTEQMRKEINDAINNNEKTTKTIYNFLKCIQY